MRPRLLEPEARGDPDRGERDRGESNGNVAELPCVLCIAINFLMKIFDPSYEAGRLRGISSEVR